MQEEKETPRFKFKDAEFVKEFPGILRCTAKFENGVVTEEDLEGAAEYKGSVGMCQVYKRQDGFFAMFFAQDLTIITTLPSVYNNYQVFHSFRSDAGLFVFEEDFSHYEEAFCIMADVNYGFEQIQKYKAFKNILDMLSDAADE